MNFQSPSPGILNSLRVRRQRVRGEPGGVQGPRQQLQRVGAVLGHPGREAVGVEVGLVQDDQPRQQQRLVAVLVMQAPSHAPGQQHAALPLVVEHQGEQRHHQDEDDGAADDGVGDAGVVAQAVVQRDEVLVRSFCGRQGAEGG